MKQGVLALGLCLMASGAWADDAGTRQAQLDAARTLLRSSGLGELMGHAARGIVANGTGLLAAVTVRECVQKGISQEGVQEDVLAPVLPAYFSLEDMNQLNAYFATPAGQQVSASFASGTDGAAVDTAIQAAMRQSPELDKAFTDFGEAVRLLPKDQSYKKAMIARVVHVMLYDCREVTAQRLTDMMSGTGSKPAAAPASAAAPQQ